MLISILCLLGLVTLKLSCVFCETCLVILGKPSASPLPGPTGRVLGWQCKRSSWCIATLVSAVELLDAICALGALAMLGSTSGGQFWLAVCLWLFNSASTTAIQDHASTATHARSPGVLTAVAWFTPPVLVLGFPLAVVSHTLAHPGRSATWLGRAIVAAPAKISGVRHRVAELAKRAKAIAAHCRASLAAPSARQLSLIQITVVITERGAAMLVCGAIALALIIR